MLRTVLFALLIAANITSMSAMQEKKPSPLERLPADCMGEICRFYIGASNKKADQDVLVNPYRDFLRLALTSRDILNFMTEVLKRNPNLNGMLKEIRINKIKNISRNTMSLALKIIDSKIDTKKKLCYFLKRMNDSTFQCLIQLYSIIPRLMNKIFTKHQNFISLLKEIKGSKLQSIPKNIMLLALGILDTKINTQEELVHFLQKIDANAFQYLIPLYSIIPNDRALKTIMKNYIKNLLSNFLNHLIKNENSVVLKVQLAIAYNLAKQYNKKIFEYLNQWEMQNTDYDLSGTIDTDLNNLQAQALQDEIDEANRKAMSLNNEIKMLVKETEPPQSACIIS